MVAIVWRGIAEPSRESCRIDAGPDGVVVESVVEGLADTCTYRMRLTKEWAFIDLVIRVGGRELDVRLDEAGWEVDGQVRPDLRFAREVDIAVTPLSNTLPIRRLGLQMGQSADITTAYVRVPELTVTTDPQRYTRTGEREYLYESRDSDFRRSVTVDDAGLVVDYPGLFVRESSAPL